MKKSKLATYIFFVLVFFSAIYINLFVTVNGIGLNPDSLSYLEAASNILNGNGIQTGNSPLTHFPPLYPILLAISGIFSSNLLDSTQWLHAILFGMNAILFGLSIYFGTSRNLYASILGILVFFSSKPILSVYSYAWSESPFLMFSLISYLLFSFFITNNKLIFLIVSSISMGLAIVTRYVGPSLIPPVVIILILFPKQSWKNKIKNLLVMGICAITPITIWIVRNLFLTQQATSRKFIYHPTSIRNLSNSFVQTFHSFILPVSGSKYFHALELIIIIFVIAFLFIKISRRRTTLNQPDYFCLCSIYLGIFFTISYIVMILISRYFFDASIPINDRILIPVYLFLTISVISMFFFFAKVEKKKAIWLMFIICVVFSIRTNFFMMKDTMIDFHQNGIGFNTIKWNESPTLSILSTIDHDIKIYSNGYDIIPFKTGLNSSALPIYFAATTLKKNDSYNEQMSTICEEVSKGDAIIVYFDDISWRKYFPKKKLLMEECQLPILKETNDGIIFGLRRILR